MGGHTPQEEALTKRITHLHRGILQFRMPDDPAEIERAEQILDSYHRDIAQARAQLKDWQTLHQGRN
jgi:hypothetical protein